MPTTRPPRTALRAARPRTLLAIVVAGTAILGAVGHEALAGSAPSLASQALRSPSSSPSSAPPLEGPSQDGLGTAHHPALGEADGAVPDGVTVFDDEIPAVAHLRPALLDALRRAETDAAGDGVELDVNSGWRSRAYQEELLQEAIAKYGSEATAARWVATPETSPHVAGDAVDIGPSRAAAWLARHGAGYGLCQIYRNEPWHYELRSGAAEHGCPARYADPTHDPRMQQGH